MSILRSLKLLQSVKAGMERPGFEKDFRIIAAAASQDFVNAALHPTLPRSDDDLIRAAGNEKVRTALRHLRFSTATVPFTDGHKMRLHHFGCGMNDIFGPLTVFHTHNYADNYSPGILTLQSSEPPPLGYAQNTPMPRCKKCIREPPHRHARLPSFSCFWRNCLTGTCIESTTHSSATSKSDQRVARFSRRMILRRMA